MGLLENYLQELNLDEAKRTGMRKDTRQQKVARAIGSLAVAMAKRKGDPDYKKMQRYLELYRKHKQKVLRKYENRVRSQARK